LNEENTMNATADQLSEFLNTAPMPTAATRIGVSIDATTTTVTLSCGSDSITYSATEQNLTIELGDRTIKVPVRDDLSPADLGTTMIDSILPFTH
jgi:hypothetical protein